MAARGPENGRRGLEVVGHFKLLSLNKFFDPSTPSMRKGDNRGKTSEELRSPQNTTALYLKGGSSLPKED